MAAEIGEGPSYRLSPGRLARGARRRTTRLAKTPFASRVHRPLLVHCATGKAGSVWFREVLLAVAREYGLQFRMLRKAPGGIPPSLDLVVGTPAWFRRGDIGDRGFRGSHVIRDPRDLVVSGYEYHKVTTEAWCRTPNPRRPGGLSYQALLSALDEHDGLMAEIDYVARRTGAEMAVWTYGQPEFLELRYEDAIADETGTFERLFRWYGFNDRAVVVGLDAVDRLSLKRGGARPNHARCGAPGEWRARFSPAHVERFKLLTGDVVVRLVYESAGDW
jgi:hypothetical protein